MTQQVMQPTGHTMHTEFT